MTSKDKTKIPLNGERIGKFDDLSNDGKKIVDQIKSSKDLENELDQALAQLKKSRSNKNI